MFKIDTEDGNIYYAYEWGTGEAGQLDKCKVITYDQDNREVVMMLETRNDILW